VSGERAARVFYLFCVLAGASVMAANILSAVGLVPIGAYGTLYRVFVFRGGIVLAGGLFALLTLLSSRLRSAERPMSAGLSFAASDWTLRGLCVSTALAFLATEVGKLAHQAEMRSFFTASGYPAWFLYVVIAVETIGSLGLLEPRVRLVAACVLALDMIGAIATHARNGDPFTDSLEAAHLLLTLVTIVGVGVLRQRVPAGDSHARAS
jgi:uncharacterized membrane protein YphA (DoxX/SURF4 family)